MMTSAPDIGATKTRDIQTVGERLRPPRRRSTQGALWNYDDRWTEPSHRRRARGDLQLIDESPTSSCSDPVGARVHAKTPLLAAAAELIRRPAADDEVDQLEFSRGGRHWFEMGPRSPSSRLVGQKRCREFGWRRIIRLAFRPPAPVGCGPPGRSGLG